MRTVVPVVLCGGEGARLWPVSRQDWPKIFLEMPDGQTLLTHAIERANQFATEDFVLAVTNEAYAFRVREQFRSCAPVGQQVCTIMEPIPKNTAPAIASAARLVGRKFGRDAILLCLPADHITLDEPGFEAAIKAGIKEAEAGHIALFGLHPAYPNISFGYIQTEGEEVLRFIEKPDAKAARSYVDSGEFLWNSGMIAASAGTLLDELHLHAPQVLSVIDGTLETAENIWIDGWVHVNLPIAHYRECESISFDHAVLEKTENLKVIHGDFSWKDIGSWESFGSLQPADEMGNHVVGDVILIDTKNSIVHSEGRTIGVAGLKNVIVVDTPNAVLVANTQSDEHIRELYEAIRIRNADSDGE